MYKNVLNVIKIYEGQYLGLAAKLKVDIGKDNSRGGPYDDRSHGHMMIGRTGGRVAPNWLDQLAPADPSEARQSGVIGDIGTDSQAGSQQGPIHTDTFRHIFRKMYIDHI